MPAETRTVRKTPFPRRVAAEDGTLLRVPESWDLLLPGDAALSRRIKKDGPSWTMIEKKGRKRFSRGIWAPADRIAALRAELEIERQDPAYERKLEAGRKRRAREQEGYAKTFYQALLDYLAFAPAHAQLARSMARAIAEHAVPVGSGTVARTKRIPIEDRAEAATIAWMRHQTTAYDHTYIPREKGKRREARRLLARESKRLLQQYRHADGKTPEDCPLKQALATSRSQADHETPPKV